MSNAELAKAYYSVLTRLPWGDELVISGLREGLNKFLSNAYLSRFAGNNKKYRASHYVSKGALEKISKSDFSDLVFEHMVPKTKHIQGPCEELAKSGGLTVKHVENLLDKYWYIASITKEENKRLKSTSMPNNWDKVNIFARYEIAVPNIILLPNELMQRNNSTV